MVSCEGQIKRPNGKLLLLVREGDFLRSRGFASLLMNRLKMVVHYMSFVAVLKHADVSPQSFTMNVSEEANSG